MSTHWRNVLCVLLLILLLILSFFASLTVGSVQYSRNELIEALIDITSGTPQQESPLIAVILQLRAPRGLLAIIVGAGLALAGVAMQTLVRNPLADPYLLGVASGASVGATAVLTFGILSGLGIYALSGGALLGAVLGTFLVYSIAHTMGGLQPLRLILIGVVMSSGFSAIASFLVFKGPDPRAAQSVMFWLLGSFSGATYAKLVAPAITLLIAASLMVLRHRHLDALMVGPDMAASVGVHVDGLRRMLFLIQAFLVGSMVAVAGGIGFVGLVIPHAARLLVGALHLRLIPVAMLCGSLFLLWVDMLARVAARPQEIPLGVVTGIIGAPLFLLMMRKGSKLEGIQA